VTVFQRSAPWTLPKPDRRYGPLRRALARGFPGLLLAGRGLTWATTSTMGLAVAGNAVLARALATASAVQRRVQVRDPELRRTVTPDYEMGCKRVLFTSGWYPALMRDDVEVVTERIEGFGERGLRTADGAEHEADLVVMATGFAATDLLAPMAVRGCERRLLSEAWADGARAYLGLTGSRARSGRRAPAGTAMPPAASSPTGPGTAGEYRRRTARLERADYLVRPRTPAPVVDVRADDDVPLGIASHTRTQST
jgi:cation diffusion facilitator CzcD-associated flavoprotein CzcO